MTTFHVAGGRAGRDVYVVTDRAEARKLYVSGVRDPIYFEAELEHLKGLGDDAIKATADIKAIFPGAMIEKTEFA